MDYSPMEPLYSAAQTRALDAAAIETHKIPGIVLMARAAQAAFDCLVTVWPEAEHVQVLCGTGNNGGDGFLIADLAHKRGIAVSVWQLGDPNKISGDAALARDQALANGVVIEPYEPGALLRYGVVVDSMLGTGLGGEVRAPYRDAIDDVNALGMPVLAVDIPSGLCSDTGRELGAAVRADVTVSFIGLKRGLYTGAGTDCAGEIEFSSLGVPAEVYGAVPSEVCLLDLASLLEQFAPRPAQSHKGSYGTVLIVGGDLGMAGAAALAGEAALRCGAGLVRVATRPEHVAALVARTPELMARGVTSGLEMMALVDAADVLVVGPGLGLSPWSEQLLQVAAESGKPMVLDADGLNLLAQGRVVAPVARDNWLLTPHPGEAARLLNCSNAEVQADRFAAAARLQQQLGGVAVLKGNGTLVADSAGVKLSDYGNPGMASGGMGDVLSGVLGGLMAQGLGLTDSASLGVCLHGAAADIAAEEGQRGLLASDLMAPLRGLLT
ncbi:MAG: NAD(P)H-hydrate dehydratase [Halieaceae bacterium]